MVRISCSHLLGSLVICRITKYQPDKAPPDWSWSSYLPVVQINPTLDNIQWLSAFSQEFFVHFELVNDPENISIEISLLRIGSWDDPVCGLEIGLEYRA